MPHPVRIFLIFGVVAALATFTTACKPAECRQMVECCAEVEDLPGVGASCKGLAQDTRDRYTCRTVTRTVRYMLEDREQPIPQACMRD
ncbi:hypothetical protein FRC96_02245 [Lujinxingia vulgaris]|uniref:Uncharacterized protein n=1 Tax=Lujinxingia vulgaris TaxID=2600176 RepID=A0A5C6XKR0_9DELT|nr:hypothetical protein [Lujinxingia vulgaris]TXD42990.1 hypothetical protein FRC96_02245 [Lujinxingia vulgaris]